MKEVVNEDLVKITKEKYYQSRKKSVNSFKMPIFGRLYKGNTDDLKKFIKIATATIIGFSVLWKANLIANDLVDYNSAYALSLEDSKITDDPYFGDYKEKADAKGIKLVDSIDTLLDINEEEKRLEEESDQYNFFNPSTYDAIQNVAERNAQETQTDFENFKEEHRAKR